ncbi:hypothetical protein [Dactylosporangium cerinum]
MPHSYFSSEELGKATKEYFSRVESAMLKINDVDVIAAEILSNGFGW